MMLAMPGESPIKPKSQVAAESDSSVAEQQTAESRIKGALSDEEQLAKFEEALKEADWGHQPC